MNNKMMNPIDMKTEEIIVELIQFQNFEIDYSKKRHNELTFELSRREPYASLVSGLWKDLTGMIEDLAEDNQEQFESLRKQIAELKRQLSNHKHDHHSGYAMIGIATEENKYND